MKRFISFVLMLVSLSAIGQGVFVSWNRFHQSSAACSEDISTGLVAFWTFNTNTISQVTNTFDTINNNPMTNFFGSYQNSVAHANYAWDSGSFVNNGYLVGPSGATLNLSNNITVALWTWMFDQPATNNVPLRYPSIWGNVTNYSGYGIYFDGGTATIKGIFGNTTNFIETPAAPGSVASTWVHLVTTVDGSKARLYTNGVEVANGTTWTGTPAAPVGTRVIAGRHYGGGTSLSLFGGRIDEVRVYNRALTAAQIQCLYQQ